MNEKINISSKFSTTQEEGENDLMFEDRLKKLELFLKQLKITPKSKETPEVKFLTKKEILSLKQNTCILVLKIVYDYIEGEFEYYNKYCLRDAFHNIDGISYKLECIDEVDNVRLPSIIPSYFNKEGIMVSNDEFKLDGKFKLYIVKTL